MKRLWPIASTVPTDIGKNCTIKESESFLGQRMMNDE